MWALREGITEAISKEGKVYKYDISIPLQAFKEVIDMTREHVRSKGLLREGAVRHVLGYGHVGDGMFNGKNARDIVMTGVFRELAPEYCI